MRVPAKLMGVFVVCAAGLFVCWAQEDYRHAGISNDKRQSTSANQGRMDGRTLTDDERLSIIAAALDVRVVRSERDCSHLVHAIYEQAGFPYSYAPSSEINARAESFVRVKQPQPGDLVVWRGHVGIVIKPSQHIFFSLMRSGPGVDDYQSPYWKGRGRPRFYRYIKNSMCAECSSTDR